MELICCICLQPLMEKETTDAGKLKLFTVGCENNHEFILVFEKKTNICKYIYDENGQVDEIKKDIEGE